MNTNKEITISQGEYKRLGDRLRTSQATNTLPLEQDYQMLQELRKSYKPVLAEVFNVLEQSMRKIDKRQAIATYRIKRIESIMSKLQRQPKMQLQRMEDIAGCRCIMKTHKDVYRLKSILSQELLIKSDRNDYIKLPKSDGYRSLHLIVCIKGKENQPIEIQLRSEDDHNWATLVEITDLVYDTKIKEIGSDPDLSRFHFLLSRKPLLSLPEKELFEIISIIKKKKFVSKLNSVFYKNSIKVRKQWEDIEKKKSENFYLIKSSKTNIPQIWSFKCYTDAEDMYFNEFIQNEDANIVLTYIPNAKFEQISKAYSNYTLTYHSFFREILPLLYNVSRNGAFRMFYTVSNLYIEIVMDSIKLQLLEFYENANSKNGKITSRSWVSDIEKRIQKQSETYNKFFALNSNDSILVKSWKLYCRYKFSKYLKNLISGKIETEYLKLSAAK